MNVRLPARLQRNPILAGTAVLLAALAIYPWLAPLPAPPISAAASDRPAPAPAAAPLPPLATFSAVFERPLFAPSRRPAESDKPAIPEAGLGRYQLLGVVDQGGARRALVADGGRAVEIAEGVALDGWTVTRIEQDRVLLSSPSGQTILRLRRPSATPATEKAGR